MRVWSRIAAVAAVAALSLASASFAFANSRSVVPTIVFKPASPANYTVAHRPASAIRLIVIHVTESSALGAITWFQNPRAQASANYVVSQQGGITEMVPDSDIAWHAGNYAINRESIGIEHAGYTYTPGSFTDAEYRASAQLVAAEMRHYLLPIDRKHIIGHYQVPDPNHPGLFGGFAHHTDPGPYWNWPLYIRYVQTYAKGGAPAPAIVQPAAAKAKPAAQPAITAHVSAGKVQVSSSGLSDGQTVQGFVKWSAQVGNAKVDEVDFLVDGRLRWTEKHAPYVFGGDGGSGWDTTAETNGAHVLTLRVVTKNGVTAGDSVRVNVANTPFTVAAASLTNGQTVGGRVAWEAVPAGASADHIDFLVDGKLAWTEKQAPYVFGGDGATWDTTKLANGPHTIALRAVAVDGRVAESSLTVNVANAAPAQTKPAAPPKASSITVSMPDFSNGKAISGRARWEAKVAGGKPDHVEFWIDGQWRWSQSSPPYLFNGNGTWDTSQEQPGQHVLTVVAVRADGYTLDRASVTVQISARQVAAMSVTSSVADGSTVHGTVPWTATVDGTTPTRVEFWIDGSLRHVEHSAPYEFGNWDTTTVANGTHALVVLAIASDGTIVKTTSNVVVANTVPTLAIASQSLTDGQTVSGTLDWNVKTSGPTPDRVEYWIDGTLRHTEHSAPYDYTWDTTQDKDGAHTLLVRAVAGSQTVQATLTVTVKNTVAAPLAIASQSLTDGQTVSGTLDWNVKTSGPTPDRIEYWIDGTLRHTEHSAPYDYTWDTTQDKDGTHTLLVRAVAGSQTVQATLTVTVKNTTTPTAPAPAVTPPPSTPSQPAPTQPPPAPAPAPSTAVAIATLSIADGSTLTGAVDWSATVTGDVRRVEFYIGNHWIGAVRTSPYGFTLDTTRLRNGTYTLTVRAVGRDGSTAIASVAVTVTNP